MKSSESETVLEVRDLVKVFRSGLIRRRRVRALDGVSLRCCRGEIYGLLGPNGAGKTTLVKILLGIVHPTSGSACIFGVPIQRSAARRRVGFLPEGHRYPGFLTTEGVLRYFGFMSGARWDAQQKHRAQKLLERVRMDGERRTRVKECSKGMMQRVGLAQALINDPEVIFLDEPTDGVDPVGRREIRELLLELKANGKTIFLNSHLLSEVERVCDRVAIMDQGRIISEGTVDELADVAAGGVRRLYRIRLARDAAAVGPGLDPELNDALTSCLGGHPPALVDGSLQVKVRDLAQLNSALDILRAQRVLVASVEPMHGDLEETFIRLIRGGKA